MVTASLHSLGSHKFKFLWWIKRLHQQGRHGIFASHVMFCGYSADYIELVTSEAGKGENGHLGSQSSQMTIHPSLVLVWV